MERLDRAALERQLIGVGALHSRKERLTTVNCDAQAERISNQLFGEYALDDWDYRSTKGHGFTLGILADFGSLIAYTVVELNRQNKRVYVVETGVHGTRQCLGYGKHVRRHMHRIVADLGYKTIATHVRASNLAAQALNVSLGMVLVRTLPDYYQDEDTGETEDALYYRGLLSEVLK